MQTLCGTVRSDGENTASTLFIFRTYKKDFFYRIFQASKESQKLFFQEAPEQKACFLYSMDLAELVYKLFDNWNDEEEVLNVPDVFDICFQDVTEELKKVLSPVSIIYKSSAVVEKIKEDDRQIRTNYNWFPKISVLDHISEMYKEYKKNNGEKASWLPGFSIRTKDGCGYVSLWSAFWRLNFCSVFWEIRLSLR